MTRTHDSAPAPSDTLVFRPLTSADALALSGLLARYAEEMRHHDSGTNTDATLAHALIADPLAETLGAFDAEALVAFAIFFDLPEAISGRRAGQLDDLYVDPSARGKRIAQRLIQAIADAGRARNWVHLRWLVPEDNVHARHAYERSPRPRRGKVTPCG